MNKKVLITLGSVLMAMVLIVASYLLYVVVSYHRIEDNLSLKVENKTDLTAPVGEKLSLITYNIGFGAYSADYSFFMDGGKYSRAFSADAVTANTNSAVETLKANSPDFILLQEVDTDGTRSYHLNQKDILTDSFSGFTSVFAENYDSPYFLYPLNQPIGANKSGILTLSKFDISLASRKSLPVEKSLNKFFDLDRAYSSSVIETSNGKNLVLYNVHLSAYTSDGTISNEQLKILREDMKTEYDNGNYVIAAGDFNKDMLGDSSKYFERSEGEFNWAAPFETSLLPKDFLVHTGENVPTCRNADSPFRGDGTDFVLSVDGIITSPNVEVIACETVDTKFAYSDHNPVKMEFILK